MEGENENLGNNPSGSRWNPTKEQINMLENLYRQGLRTPSAEQIQQITHRLKAFGHIEGKNVFYWFQNHKARQRQKQKQHSFAYFNRFLHATATSVFPQYRNVVCSPCYIPPAPQTDVGFYHPQYPKVTLPTGGGFKRRILNPTSDQEQNKMLQNPRRKNEELLQMNRNDQETLDLFPIHPTGILESRNGIDTTTSATENTVPSPPENDCSIIFNGHDDHDHHLHHHHNFF